MEERNTVLRYLINTYYDGDAARVAECTRYTEKQIAQWMSGEKQPQRDTIEYIIHCAFTPEFKVVVEYGEFRQDQPVKTQLKQMFRGHEDRAGIYAFYDSMGNLLYLGKATNILDECYSAINREVDVYFPSGIKNKPEKRREIVRYISAYDVGSSNWLDYPRHVESLILRISKPPFNKIIGTLEKAFTPLQVS